MYPGCGENCVDFDSGNKMATGGIEPRYVSRFLFFFPLITAWQHQTTVIHGWHYEQRTLDCTCPDRRLTNIAVKVAQTRRISISWNRSEESTLLGLSNGHFGSYFKSVTWFTSNCWCSFWKYTPRPLHQLGIRRKTTLKMMRGPGVESTHLSQTITGPGVEVANSPSLLPGGDA